MADIPWFKRLNDIATFGRASAFKCPLGADQNSAPLQFGHMADRCLQVVGTFDGTTLTVEGTNDWVDDPAPTWTGLHDTNGDVISITSAAIVQILENPARMRLVTTGGDDATTTAIVGYLHIARS